MKEYEYSFKVDSIKPYIDYCINNKYNKVSVTRENRIIYECSTNSNLIARITTNDKNVIILDFKNICSKNNDLNISKESLPINITQTNKDAIYSMLDILGFNKTAENIRTRYVFQLYNIKFEIDEYELPKMNVVAIEGDKDKVDIIYNNLTNNKELNKINTYNFNINDRAFNAIKNKTKKVEIRVTKLDKSFDYSILKSNDIIYFSNSNKEIIKCKIKKINWYKTIEELLTIEGTKYTLSSTNDFHEGVKSIKSFEGYKEGIKINGVYAIHVEYIKENL